MAYHYNERGYTKLIIGNYYKPHLNMTSSAKLLFENTATGCCKINFAGNIIYISSTKLSHWHRVSLFNE